MIIYLTIFLYLLFCFVVDQFDWQQACLEREHAHKVWTNIDDYLEHFTYNAGLFASVDAVHLMQV